MARVRSADTAPERAVRSILHRGGYRFRLHSRELPGTPDLVFPRRRLAVFVHGCFWHRHSGCRRATVPTSRREFWLLKLNRNEARDREAIALLKAMGWSVLVVWECSTRRTEDLTEALSVAFDRKRLELAATALKDAKRHRPHFTRKRRSAVHDSNATPSRHV
jgi:DNA mismatch endonuclease (patch repair protein)